MNGSSHYLAIWNPKAPQGALQILERIMKTKDENTADPRANFPSLRYI